MKPKKQTVTGEMVISQTTETTQQPPLSKSGQTKNIATKVAPGDQTGADGNACKEHKPQTQSDIKTRLEALNRRGRNAHARNFVPTPVPESSSTAAAMEVANHDDQPQDFAGGGTKPGVAQAELPTIPKPDVGMHEIEIAHGRAKGIYTVHPAARLFPLLQGRAYDELVKSIKNEGQQEHCVVDGNIFLDGRNRIRALNDLGREPRVIQFGDLKTGLTPAAWVMTQNLHRRLLTNDQYLAVFAKYLEMCRAERQGSEALAQSENRAGKAQGAADGSASATDPEYRQKPADNTGRRKRGHPPGKRSEARGLAKATKQTRYRAEQMIKIREQSPELAADVEGGDLSLKEAVQKCERRNQPKTARPHREKNAAVVRVKQMLSKLAMRLGGDEKKIYWQEVATFAQQQVDATEEKR